jgi:hypothetical protein
MRRIKNGSRKCGLRRWSGLAAALSFIQDPRFREAVTWQNPELVRNWFDNPRLRRRQELAIASYPAHRYPLHR